MSLLIAAAVKSPLFAAIVSAATSVGVIVPALEDSGSISSDRVASAP